jgi:hypothetical protein
VKQLTEKQWAQVYRALTFHEIETGSPQSQELAGVIGSHGAHMLPPTPKQSELEERYRQFARKRYQVESLLDFDDEPVVSLGDDNGAYVQCWRWVRGDEIGRHECDDCDKVYDGAVDECPYCAGEMTAHGELGGEAVRS